VTRPPSVPVPDSKSSVPSVTSFPVEEAAQALRERLGSVPEVLVVLGSGLGGLTEAVEGPQVIPFSELPGFPAAGVAGHGSRFVAGTLEGRSVLLQAGRFHFYEGHPAAVVAGPVRVAAHLGVERAIFTNAAGGIDPRFGPGTLMLIEDHINFMGRSPLVGPVAEGEVRFPDMSTAYDAEYRDLARRVALEQGISLERGVYAGVLGPNYETPAEIRMLGRLGATAVGMSTVPEVIVARARGMRVMAVSLITNAAAGISLEELSHEEVLEAGQEAAPRLEALIRGVIREM